MQLVAILLATYNGEKYIEEFLISLQGQTFQNYICYIHDDGSKDRTRRIAEEFEKRDPGHFQILEGPSQGGAKENFLWMLGQIEAEYYMFADQDDVWLPEKIEKSVRTITEKKEEPQAENHEAYEHHEHHKIMHHIHECGHVHSDECEEDCHHKNGCCVDNIFLDAFKHTFEIMLYLFIFTFIMELILQTYSIDIFRTILTDNVYIQILIACVVGLIPNCASSVFLVELYMLEGVLSFPALVAGLSTGAGVGLFILISRNRKHPLKSLGIVALQFAIGVISGIVVNLFYMLAV